MRTTLEIPDSLMRDIRVRAALSDRTLTQQITNLLRAGLNATAETAPEDSGHVQLPLVRTSRNASTDELSPQRVGEILAQSDVSDLAK